MLDIVSITLVLAACIFVAAPLFSKQQNTRSRVEMQQYRVTELLQLHRNYENTINDLEFDLQTGKLSEEDYTVLVADNRKSQAELDNQIRNLSGIGTQELSKKLEREIAAERGEVVPDPIDGTCPECGNPSLPTDKFCSNCGHKL